MEKEILLSENDIQSLQKPMDDQMNKALIHLETELTKLRTGRAHTSLLENISVVAYDQTMQLHKVAALSAPEARLLTIQPWDLSIIGDIERAILASDLGVTPINDGKIIRIQLSEMSSERREELIKVLGKKLEECKVTIRNVRKSFNNLIRDAKKDKTISENFFNRLEDVIQKATDSFVAKADKMAEKKKKDLTTI